MSISYGEIFETQAKKATYIQKHDISYAVQSDSILITKLTIAIMFTELE